MSYQDAYRPPTQFSVFPPVIKNLLIINVLVFVAQFLNDAFLTQYFALWPLGNFPDIIQSVFGARRVGDFWPWQLITYSFLHGGFGHIFFNMFALWMFGVQIENTWGTRRFAVFYFICVIGAGLTQLVVATIAAQNGQIYPTVGASGGVFGILLAFGMMFPDRYIFLLFPPIPIKAKWFVIGYGALELWAGISGTSSGVAHFAHLGGMVFGFLLIQYWRGKLPVQPERTMYW
ncbi:MAG: rhomboid family intramembrane serine protease [Bacteroidetes bacterium]|jgi:membrane associated rhomboid family serine protease|nr:rhomboid family intramembrane serine protease [Bacteroidota bacterium]